MKEIKIEAKTINEAVEKGLKELNLSREQAEVEIIQEGRKGILGLGARKACVLVREKKWTGKLHEVMDTAYPDVKKPRYGRRNERYQRRERPVRKERPRREADSAAPAAENAQPQVPAVTQTFDLKSYNLKLNPTENPAEDAKNLLTQILTLSGITASVEKAEYEESKKMIYISFASQDSGLFLYDEARGLLSLQYVVSSIINKNREGKLIIKLDTADFWQRTEEKLKSDVEYGVNFVKKTGKSFRMRPMTSQLRKVVHDMVKNNYPEFETLSEGEEKWRKVVIKPAQK